MLLTRDICTLGLANGELILLPGDTDVPNGLSDAGVLGEVVIDDHDECCLLLKVRRRGRCVGDGDADVCSRVEISGIRMGDSLPFIPTPSSSPERAVVRFLVRIAETERLGSLERLAGVARFKCVSSEGMLLTCGYFFARFA